MPKDIDNLAVQLQSTYIRDYMCLPIPFMSLILKYLEGTKWLQLLLDERI